MNEETKSEIKNEIKTDASQIVIALIAATVVLSILGFMAYMWYMEYKDWQDTKQLIRDNNGTCIDKGYSVECSYTNHQDPICTQNGQKINCSDIMKGG